jgi:hypothetical protein
VLKYTLVTCETLQTYRLPRTSPQRYACHYFTPSTYRSIVHSYTHTDSHHIVQETPRARQDRPNPLPRQHHRPRNVRVPPRHRARPANRQGRLRRRGAQPRALKSSHARLAAHRLHTWTHNHTAGRRRQPANSGAADGRGRAAVGRHAQVRGI